MPKKQSTTARRAAKRDPEMDRLAREKRRTRALVQHHRDLARLVTELRRARVRAHDETLRLTLEFADSFGIRLADKEPAPAPLSTAPDPRD